VSVKEVRDDLI